MKTKIKIEAISKAANISKIPDGFTIKGTWPIIGQVISSSMGRRVIEVNCPACEELQTAYAWSFFGGGKLCRACGVKMTHHGGFVAFSALSKKQIEQLLSMAT